MFAYPASNSTCSRRPCGGLLGHACLASNIAKPTCPNVLRPASSDFTNPLLSVDVRILQGDERRERTGRWNSAAGGQRSLPLLPIEVVAILA